MSGHFSIVLGSITTRHHSGPFGMLLPDRLFHFFIVGQTGAGKSTLLETMLRQDVLNRQGFCLIDPHGDLAEKVVRFAGGRVLYWNLPDPLCTLGYNPLGPVSEQYRPLVVSGLIDALKKQWEDAWGARMEHLLRYALLALIERGDSTLQDIMPMFLDKEWRGGVVAEIRDPQVKQFWEVEFPAMNYRTAVDGVAPIANKLGAFLAHPVVRKALCAPDTPLHFTDLLRTGQSLVVNLGKGRLGSDTANVVGGLIVSALGLAAYQRQEIPEAERTPYFLYVDEFHAFTTSAFADMLSELRKYGMGLVATTQHTSRLSVHVREAIFGNVGTIIAFRLGATDADLLSKQFGEGVPRASDFVGLANYHLYLKMMVGGVQTKPFSAQTLPPSL